MYGHCFYRLHSTVNYVALTRPPPPFSHAGQSLIRHPFATPHDLVTNDPSVPLPSKSKVESRVPTRVEVELQALAIPPVP
jgi:hypothetical protein